MVETKQAKDAADRFIARIKKGTLRKEIAPNSSTDYPTDRAYESFKHFIHSDQYKPFLTTDEK